MVNKKLLHICDACCEGQLHPKTSMKTTEYRGIQSEYILYYSVCDVCKAELADGSDMLKNKREFIRLKKKIDDIPMGSEVLALRKKHNLTQSLAAKIFGGGPVAFSKYENDDLIPDESMVSLLKLAISCPDTIQSLAQIKMITLPGQELIIKPKMNKAKKTNELWMDAAKLDFSLAIENFDTINKEALCLEDVYSIAA